MRRVLVVAAVVVVLPAALARPDGETYSSPEGYKVKFPGKPQETTRKLEVDGVEVNVRLATYATSRGEVYMTSVSPAPVRPGSPQDFLGEVVREVAKAFDGKLIESEETKFGPGQVPRRTFTVQKDRTYLHGFVFSHGDRLYQVAVTGSKSFVEGKDAKAFLNSFTIAK